ncbi:hypothetical protein F4859DRAFT_526152 [Xylaria cf. heliscus]|nr:hypothetical protein F4859DRAFT_526152 [Xylaria cf. heliscus]
MALHNHPHSPLAAPIDRPEAPRKPTSSTTGGLVVHTWIDVLLIYSELEFRANQLVSYLVNVQQIKPKVIVGLSLHKGPLLVTAILAVLKAGSAWVPLALDSPRSRIQKILEVSDPEIVLSEQMATAAGPTDLCHILFTSGWTGVPKGVMLEHQAVAHNARTLTDRFGVGDQTRTLQFATYTFDIFSLDLFMTFQAGGCLVMAGFADMMANLTSFINCTRINYAQLTPTIISFLDPTGISTLEVLVSSGEQLTADIIQRWAGCVRLINAYGPTETIVCTIQEMSVACTLPPSSSIYKPGSQMIGTALPGLEVLLMQEDSQEEAPVGTVGEICVAGVQLCRGFIGMDIDKTGPNPFFKLGQQRFYRAGDLGFLYSQPDSVESTICLIGRKDSQVKLHGVRIDLGDVETALASYAGTRKSVASVPKTGPMRGKLAAVVSVADPGPWLLVETSVTGVHLVHPSQPSQKSVLTRLTDCVRSHLPPQAVPSTWWVIDELPLTASGKIDRMRICTCLESIQDVEIMEYARAWATTDIDKEHPVSNRGTVEGDKVVALERKLVNICSEILGLSPDAIEPQISLLQAGFDSLDILRLASIAVREGLDLSVEQILREPSIRQLSRTLATSSSLSRDKVDYESFSLVSPHDLQDLKVATAEQCHIEPEDILDIYPCTPLQAGILTLAARSSQAYVCNFNFPIPNNVKVDCLRGAWDSLVLATPSLRNRLVHHNTSVEFYQVTTRYDPTSWDDDDESFEKLMTFGSKLCRCRVIRDNSKCGWKFVLKIHHAIFDGSTIDRILLGLQEMYYGTNISDNSVSITTGTPFTEYISYLVKDIENHEAEHVSFWGHRLAKSSITPFPNVPLSWLVEHTTTHTVLSDDVSIEVCAIAQRYDVSATTVIQTAWAVVLGKHAGTDDVIFGATLSGRNTPINGIDTVIGPALTTVPCRVRWDEAVSISQLLQRLYRESIDMIPHQHYGLQNISAIGPNEKNACLFRTLLVVQPRKADITHPEGFLQADDSSGTDIVSTYPITVEFTLPGKNMSSAEVRLHYDESLITQEMAKWVLRHLESALNYIGSADFGAPVSDIDITDIAERQLLVSHVQKCPEKIDRCLHSLVEATVGKYPDHIAILQRSPWKEVTYKELDQSSTALARYLQHVHDIGPGRIIPIGFEKSTLAIVAILGVLKAGAAYVSLDTSQPAQHLQRILKQLNPTHSLCSEKTYSKMQRVIDNPIQISDSWLLHILSSTDLPPGLKYHASTTDNAIVFFTSGSTGHPKCVASRHSAVSTSMYHTAKVFRLEAGARVFQSTSFTFDMSLKDIYCSLLSGACICLPSDEDRLSTAPMREMNVSVALLTPSVAEAIMPDDVPSLRILNLGGEKATAALIKRWAGRVRLIISYGPTETISCITFADAVQEDADPADIGHPVTGQGWIVQRNSGGALVPAATGCIGELAITGHTVARGYHEDPTRTAKCFVEQSPWMRQGSGGGSDSAFLYLTGDYARKDELGRVLIAGRKDSRVGINGIRIESAEAEYHLRQLGGVFTSAIVEAVRRPLSPTDQSIGSSMALVAFVKYPSTSNEIEDGVEHPPSSQSLIIKSPGEVPSAFQLKCQEARRQLAHMLPTYLMPGVFVPVRAIPMSIAGKTDRKGLRTALENSEYRDHYVAPKAARSLKVQDDASTPLQKVPLNISGSSDELQRHLCQIWQAVLNSERSFNASDNFFRFGGDSLLAIRLVTTCRQQGLQMEVLQIYRNPTLGEMAAVVAAIPDPQSDSARHLELPAAPPFSMLSKASCAEILAEAADICGIGAYMARWVYSLPGSVDLERLKNALNTVVTRNPIFRTALAHTSKGTMQIVLNMAEWMRRRPSRNTITEAGEHLKVEGNAGLFRYELGHRENDKAEAYLQLDVHHVLYDEWTMQCFLHDLAIHYNNPGNEIPGRLGYVHFIRHLEDHMRNNSDKAMSFWRRDLEGVEEPSFPLGPSTGSRFKTNSVVYSSESIPSQHNGVPSAQETPVITPATRVAAAFSVLLSYYEKNDDIAFGMTFSGRHFPGLEEVLGPTISTVPLRVRIEGRQAVSSFLVDVQSKIRTIHEYQYVGLHQIANLEVKGAREASAFRTLLVVQHELGSDLNVYSSKGEELQMTIFEKDTFISLNYGFVVVLTTDKRTCQSKLRAEFDARYITEKQAHAILQQLVQIIGQLSHTDCTINALSDEGKRDASETRPANHATLGIGAAGSRMLEQRTEWTAHQVMLRDLWAKELSIPAETIGLKDDIHSLGGDSITLIRLLSAARKVGLSVNIDDGINHFTRLAEMAGAIDMSRGEIIGARSDVHFAPEPFSLMVGLSREECITDAASKCGVNPETIADVYPCTNLQEALMALSSIEPGSYFVQHCYNAVGHVDQVRLQSALRRIWQAEAILRTRIFINSKFDMVQAVLNEMAPEPLQVYEGYRALSEFLVSDRQVTFKYGKPLTRVALVLDVLQRTYLVISQHHAVSDGWTIRLLLEAIKKEYVAPSEFPRQKPAINSIPAFVKFVCGVQGSKDAVRFWKSTLLGACVTEFPSLPGNGMFRTTETFMFSLPIPGSLKIAPSSLLEASWGLVLNRYTGSNDVCFGIVRSGRMAAVPNIEGIMAPTIATVPLRLRTQKELHVSRYLEDVASFGNRVTPFEQYGLSLIRRLGADAKTACSFRTVLIVQPTNKSSEGQVASPSQLILEAANEEEPMVENYGLTIDCQPCHDGTLIVQMNYDSTVLSAAEVEKTAKHFSRAIVRLCENPHSLLRDIDVFVEHGPAPRASLASLKGNDSSGVKSFPVNGNGTITSNSVRKDVMDLEPPSECGLQDTLRRLWADVLRIEPGTIGPEDDFLMLGGDSILAIKLSSYAREHGITLSARSILPNPDLKSMSAKMSMDGEQQVTGSPPPPQSRDLSSTRNSTYHLQISETYDIAAGQIEDVYPCTPLQASLMAVTLRERNAYVSTETFRLAPHVDRERFMKAWDLVYQRHELLRTRLCQVFDHHGHAVLMQVVCAGDSVPWYIDSCGNIHNHQQQLLSLPEMSLGTSLSRFSLIQTATAETYVTLTRHHSIYDGWSTRLLWDDFHCAFMEGNRPSPRPLFRSYVEYLQQVDRDAIEDFWRRELDGFRAQHYPPLPSGESTQRVVTASMEFDTKIGYGHGPVITTAGFPSIARAAWALVLAFGGRWPSDTYDICFGAVVSGRLEPVHAIEHIAGPTMSTVPVQLKIEMSESVVSYVGRVRDCAMAATNAEHIGLSDISRLSNWAKAACQFRNILVVQSPEYQWTDETGTEADRYWEPINSRGMQHSHPLIVECTPRKDGSGFRVGALFDETLILESETRVLLRNLSRIILLLADRKHSDQPIAELLRNLASIEDYQEMAAFNSRPATVPNTCLQTLFEKSAQSCPQRLAIIAHDRQLTYGALDKACNGIALYLQQEMGINTNTLVPICFEKSSFMVLAILSILKAGGCYVPLDPSRPRARLKNMIARCKPSFILSSASQRSLMVDLVDVPVLVVDSTLLKQCGEQPNLAVSSTTRYAVGPQHLAYVIFTSGSTGPPKGVLMEHGSMASNMMHHADIFQFPHEGEFRVLQFSSYTFDVSVAEIFATLAFGGTVCVPSEEDRLNDIAGVITSMGVEMAFLTPTMASILKPSDVPGLKMLCLTGELSTTSVLKAWSTSPANSLFNAYGPTEAAVHCAAGRVLPSTSPSNIGTPFGGQLWIVDPDNPSILRPVGCIGEIVISGPTLARGYLGDQEETEKGFIDDVSWFDGVSPRKLYKTGDMARYRGDGTIEFLGRKDARQVKFHGFRIELGEIEAALHSVDRDGIFTAVAVEKMRVMTTDALVAFVQIKIQSIPNNRAQALLMSFNTLDHETKLSLQKVFRSLEKLLPQCMIPSLLLPVSQWPRSTSGKTNRDVLRILASSLTEDEVCMYRCLRDYDDSDGLAPKFSADYNTTPQTKASNAVSKPSGDDHRKGTHPTDTQNMVVSFWRRALRRGPEFFPRLDHNFFSSGGDSVSAISLVADFRREGIHATVRDLYRLKSLSAMVEFVEQQRRPDGSITQSVADIDKRRTITIPSMGQADSLASRPLLNEVANSLDISPDSIQDIYPCTPLQEGIMFLSERTKGAYHACLSLLMPRRLELDRLYKAFRALVAMHDILRTRYIFHQSLGSIQVVLTAPAHFRDADNRKSQDEEGSAKFAYGLPLYRYSLIARDDRVYLQLDCHHSIYDGWSLPLMLNDLRCLYRDVSYLPRPPHRPFKDVVAYMHDPAVVQVADEFWKRVLQGAVISDFPEMGGRTSESIQATTYIEHSFPLNQDTNGQDMGIATLLTAAWSLVVSNYTGSEDVCFGFLLSGRDIPIDGIECVRGPTINTVPFRIALQRQSATVGDLLESIQARTLDIMPHQFTSLTKLRRLFSDGRGDFGSLLSIQTRASPIDETVAGNHNDFDVSTFTSADDGENTPAVFGEPYPLFIGVTVDQVGDRVSVGAQYDSTIVSMAQVNRVVAQFEVAFHQLANMKLRDRLLSDITLLSETDKQCLLDWAGPQIEPGDACVHEIIEKLATEHPHRQALEGFTESLTYAQLDQQANSLAAHVLHLTHGKIRRGATVLIWMETSARAVVAILAVLKLGASYVPLDHRLPLARAEYIVHDVGSDIILVSRDLFGQAVELAASLKSQQAIMKVIQVDEALKTMKMLHEPRSRIIGPHLVATMSDLAYVIYTSGSTGKPKGVMMEHRALSATVRDQAITYGFNSATRMFGLASLSWDPSLLEIFAVLCHGGCLCIPTEDERSGCHDLVSSINRHRANQISTSPAVASLIDLRCTPTVEVISLGGEVIREENIVNAQKAGVRLFNMYGPSEACIDAIVHRNVVPGVSPQNIGTPMSSQVWIVDPADPRRQVPPGCIGEIALSGTLARGYLNDAAKTAQAFLTNCPFASRVYLIGDLGRYEPDGSIYFLGRKDRQVKLNGQRVELGDIESGVKTFYPQHDVVVDFFPASGDDKKSLVVFLAPSVNNSSVVPISVQSRMQPDTTEFQRLQTQLKPSCHDKVDFKSLRATYAEWISGTTARVDSQTQTSTWSNGSSGNLASYSSSGIKIVLRDF